jgi:putative restriction endonuclease
MAAMAEGTLDDRVRAAAIAWLDARRRRGLDVVRHDELAAFEFEGHRLPLIDLQRGIRKPRMLEAALSLRTTFTPPSALPPYEDQQGPDGLLRYKYRGEDPQHPDNVALRRAMQLGQPLIWFVGVAPGVYEAIYPVWLIDEEPTQFQFVVALDEAQRYMPRAGGVDEDRRRYVERLTKLRLHQPVFRARVLRAYGSTCAMCRLKHAELLDAAHILPDSHPHGQPVVPNGLSLCKIHHAAYDLNIIGVRPDLVVEVQRRLLDEVDGPMLRHGIQDMAGVTLLVPNSRTAQPDPTRLEERYEAFRNAS